MAKNPFGKGRKQDAPYAIYTSGMGWEWRILKTYKLPVSEASDHFARWFVAARSPHTWGSFELGDTYRRDVITHGRLVAAEPEWVEAMQANGYLSYGLKVPTPAEWIAQQAEA
jgi:hypothetical protein